jgi:hypothetical protein
MALEMEKEFMSEEGTMGEKDLSCDFEPKLLRRSE